MMTWYLWQLFYRTLPQHPLFWYRFDSGNTSSGVSRAGALRRLGMFTIAVLILPFAWLMGISFFLLMPGYLLLAATIGGSLVAFSVSRQVIREQEAGRYEQIAVTSEGDFGLSSALAMRVLRRQQNLRPLLRLVRAVHAILFFTALAIVILNFLFMRDLSEATVESGLPILLIVFAFVIMLQVDFIQALLLGALVGMISPTLGRHGDAPLLAVGMLVLLQFGLYLIVVVAVMIAMAVLNITPDFLWDIEGLLPALLTALLTVFTAHEVLMFGMWRILADRLNFNPRLLRTTERYGS
jgi:hypothetical protein